LHDRTCPINVQCVRVFQFDDRTRSTSGHSRSDASDRSGSLLDSNRTLALWCPVISPACPVIVLLCDAQARPARSVSHGTSVSGRSQRVRSARQARPVAVSQLAIVRPTRLVSASPLSRCATGASGQCDQRVQSAQLWLS
jgi:hypothetical protein